MIEIKATTRRVFLFPAPISSALDFFSDFRRIAQFLPHISLVRGFDNGRYRLLYSTVEMASYEVRIFADVELIVEQERQTLTIRPASDIVPVKSKANLRSLTAPGSYSSRSLFRKTGDFECEIEYDMALGAVLPRPTGLKFVPGNMLNKVADNITHKRMEEIIDGFIVRSMAAFSSWQEVQASY